MGFLDRFKKPKAGSALAAPDHETSSSIADGSSAKAADLPTAAVTEGSAPGDDDDVVYPHGLKLVLILLAICLSIFLLALDQTIIATAIPKITDEFSSIQDIGWYGSAYLLTATAFQPTFGRIYTIFSIKGTFLTAITIFEIGSLICALAPNSTAFIVGRAIAGIGCGGLFSGGVTILAYCLPLHKRPLFFGMIGATFGVASVTAPLIGGAFTDRITWRWCFYINLPIGGLAIAVVLLVLKISRVNNPKKLTLLQRILQLDLIGMAILLPAVVCLLLALQWGGSTYAWNSSQIIGLFVGFAAITTLFIVSQLKLGDKGTLPPRLFKNRNILAAMSFAFFFGAGFFAMVYYLAIYFQSVKGSSPTQAGLELLPLMISTVISSIVTGGLITSFGYYTPVLIFCMSLFTIGSGLITTYDLTTPFGRWFGYQVLAGAGIGAGFQGAILVVQTVLPLAEIPVGTACVSFFQQLGGALFVSVAQSVFQNGLLQGLERIEPPLPAAAFLHSGATSIRPLLAALGRPDALDGVLAAYVEGLRNCFAISVACAGMAFLSACALQWRSVKKAPTKATDIEGGAPAPMAVEQKTDADV